MVLSGPEEEGDYLDRDEALQAEMLAAQQQQGGYPELQQYNDYTEDQEEAPHDNRELEQVCMKPEIIWTMTMSDQTAWSNIIKHLACWSMYMFVEPRLYQWEVRALLFTFILVFS